MAMAAEQSGQGAVSLLKDRSFKTIDPSWFESMNTETVSSTGIFVSAVTITTIVVVTGMSLCGSTQPRLP